MIHIPILTGPMRGIRWSPASGGKILRVFLGSYEPEQTGLFTEHIAPGGVLFDIGAHVGYYTMLSSRLVGASGRVVSFEPNPRNAAFLHGHVAANQVGNVTVFETALGHKSGVVRFDATHGSGTGSVSAEGNLEVMMHRLDDVVEEMGVAPTHLKIDVEGGEHDVLSGGRETLAKHRPTIFLSTHGSGVHISCCDLLAQFGYAFTPILGDDWQATSELLCTPRAQESSAAA